MRFKTRQPNGQPISRASHLQYGYVCTATNLPEELLRACPFQYNNDNSPYSMWGIAGSLKGGLKPSSSAYPHQQEMIAKLTSIVIPVLRKHINEKLITFDEIDEIWKDSTPEFRKIAAEYINAHNRFPDDPDYLVWNGEKLSDMINDPFVESFLSKTEDWQPWSEVGGQIKNPGYGDNDTQTEAEDLADLADAEEEHAEDLRKKSEEAKEELEDAEIIAGETRTMADEKKAEADTLDFSAFDPSVDDNGDINLGTFESFLAWMRGNYATEQQRYTTSDERAEFAIYASNDRLCIKPKSSGKEIWLSTNQLKKYFTISNTVKEMRMMFKPKPYEYQANGEGGMHASYWCVIIKEYLVSKLDAEAIGMWSAQSQKIRFGQGGEHLLRDDSQEEKVEPTLPTNVPKEFVTQTNNDLPSFNEIMKPLLEYLVSEYPKFRYLEYSSFSSKNTEEFIQNLRLAKMWKEYTVRGQIEDHLADHFGLSDEQKNKLKPSGNERLFLHTIRWCITHLLYAELIIRPRENVVSITARGMDVLLEEPDVINEAYLNKFPEYREKRDKGKQPKVRKVGEKLEINGEIVTEKTLIIPVIRFLSDGEWHTKSELDAWLRDELFHITEEEERNVMYESSGHSVLYHKTANAISTLRNVAKWLKDWKENPESNLQMGKWKLNELGLQISTFDDYEIEEKLDELHISGNSDRWDMEPNVEEFDNDQIPKLTKEEIDAGIKKIQEKLWVDPTTIHEIVVNLMANKPILLVGPVGTGKTELARMVPEILWKDHGGYFSEVYTATADWTTHDVIGGIVPKMTGDTVGYKIENGCVTHAVLENWNQKQSKRNNSKQKSYVNESEKTFRGVWLVIDEFNRADIDKAFGQIFTSIETKKLKIPTNQEKDFDELNIPNDFRIIGTLNSADKHTLFHLSDALKRRFAIIQVGMPPVSARKDEIEHAVNNAFSEIKHITTPDESPAAARNDLYKDLPYDILRFVRYVKPLGTAMLKSIYQTLLVSNSVTGSDVIESLDIALTNNLSPQLESLDKEFLHILQEIVTEGGNPIQVLQKNETDKTLRAEYAESFGAFLDYLGFDEDEIKLRMRQFLANNSVFEEAASDGDGKFLKEVKDANDLNFWHGENNLKKFPDSIDEIRKTLI